MTYILKYAVLTWIKINELVKLLCKFTKNKLKWQNGACFQENRKNMFSLS